MLELAQLTAKPVRHGREAHDTGSSERAQHEINVGKQVSSSATTSEPDLLKLSYIHTSSDDTCQVPEPKGHVIVRLAIK